MLTPFDAFTGTLVGSKDTLYYMGVPDPMGRFGGLNPPANTETYVLMIHQGAAPISDFASYEITFDLF